MCEMCVHAGEHEGTVPLQELVGLFAQPPCVQLQSKGLWDCGEGARQTQTAAKVSQSEMMLGSGCGPGVSGTFS